jgi:hypothetical protein
MTDNAFILGISIGMGLLGSLAYLVGRYQAALIDKIRTLEGQTREVTPKPSVTMGVLTPPRDVGESDAPVGIAEAKTAQRVEWESEQETERQGRGL